MYCAPVTKYSRLCLGFGCQTKAFFVELKLISSQWNITNNSCTISQFQDNYSEKSLNNGVFRGTIYTHTTLKPVSPVNWFSPLTKSLFVSSHFFCETSTSSLWKLLLCGQTTCRVHCLLDVNSSSRGRWRTSFPQVVRHIGSSLPTPVTSASLNISFSSASLLLWLCIISTYCRRYGSYNGRRSSM